MFFSDTDTNREANLEKRMAKLYQAERNALDPKVLQDSIKAVGLKPWNPDLIRENCRKHSPPDLKSDAKDLVDVFAQKVSMYSQRQKDEIERIRSTVKHISAPITPKTEKRKRATKVSSLPQANGNEEEPYLCGEETMTTSTEPTKKRSKKMHLEPKACAAKGCQETHFWSKKWVFCPKCKKNFCEKHKGLLRHHKC